MPPSTNQEAGGRRQESKIDRRDFPPRFCLLSSIFCGISVLILGCVSFPDGTEGEVQVLRVLGEQGEDFFGERAGSVDQFRPSRRVEFERRGETCLERPDPCPAGAQGG